MVVSRAKKMKYRYFWLSFAIAFFILSVMFLMLIQAVHPKAAKTTTVVEPEAEDMAYTPQRADCLNVLFIGVSADGTEAGIFLLARFDPVRGKTPITAFPRETRLQSSGKTETLADAYRYGGADYTRTALANTLGVTIDRYVRMDEGAFVKAADAVGAVEYNLRQELSMKGSGNTKMVLGKGLQLLDGRKAADILTHREYADGELGRCATVSDLTAAIINQRIDISHSTVVDKLFERIINMISTDISYVDYDNRKAAAQYMADLEEPVAVAIAVNGAYSEDKAAYILADTYIALVTQTFS